MSSVFLSATSEDPYGCTDMNTKAQKILGLSAMDTMTAVDEGGGIHILHANSAHHNRGNRTRDAFRRQMEAANEAENTIVSRYVSRRPATAPRPHNDISAPKLAG